MGKLGHTFSIFLFCLNGIAKVNLFFDFGRKRKREDRNTQRNKNGREWHKSKQNMMIKLKYLGFRRWTVEMVKMIGREEEEEDEID